MMDFVLVQEPQVNFPPLLAPPRTSRTSREELSSDEVAEQHDLGV
jgi:hypothetical protein